MNARSLAPSLLCAWFVAACGSSQPQPSEPTTTITPAPKPTTDALKVEDRPGERKNKFDREEVQAIVQRAVRTANQCPKIHTEGPFGDLTVALELSSTRGRVSDAKLPAPFDGTAIGKCIEKAFEAEIIPNWEGPDEHMEAKLSLKKPEAPAEDKGGDKGKDGAAKDKGKDAPAKDKGKEAPAKDKPKGGKLEACAVDETSDRRDDVRDGGVVEAHVERQRQGLARGLLGVVEGREPGGRGEGRHVVQGGGVIDRRRDALGGEVIGERVAALGAHDHLLRGVADGGRRAEGLYVAAQGRERVAVPFDEAPPLGDVVVEALELHAQHRGLQGVEAAVAPELVARRAASRSRANAVLTQRAQARREGVVVGRDRAAVAEAAERLARKEAEAGGLADRPGPTPLGRTAQRLRGVFDDRQVVPVGERA
jgi:hypothetical protein